MVKFSILSKFFKKLDNRIDYKPYPAIRYADNDITMQVIKKSKNLNVVGTHIDFRYIIYNEI